MKYNHRDSKLWLGISLLFSCYYGICFYYFVFSQEYVVQDDVRQHIVWLQKYIDPDLFPHDLIADYFSGLAPLGFEYLYLFVAKTGIEPILFAKLLPPVLAIATTIYIYLFTLQILPIPIAGFISSLLMNQLIWLNDDLVSSTARAFIYPLFAAWLYYLAIEAIIPCLFLMLIQGLFYPHILLIEMGMLSLRLIEKNRKTILKLTKNKRTYIQWFAGIIVTAIALYPMTQKTSELAATVVTAIQMQQMPEFNAGGRTPYFGVGVFKYWLTGSTGFSLSIFPTIVWTGLALPFILNKKKYTAKLITNKIYILLQVIVASLTMFILAHILLPTLHLPSRYTYHSLRFVQAISSGITITIWLDSGKQWLRSKKQFNLIAKTKITLVTLFALATIIIPAIPFVINLFQGWEVGTAPAIYQYLAQQPKDITVASLSNEVDNIPAFSQRSILVGGEFAMAYHPIYYEQIKQRTVDLLQAQYSPNLQTLQSFIKQYNVDYLLLDKTAFTPEYLSNKDWLINSSWSTETKNAIAILKSNNIPAIKQFITSCTVVSTENLNLLNADCINNKL